MKELKRCPFCGSEAEKVDINYIRCSDIVSCCAEIISGDSGPMTEEYTVNAWNKRASPTNKSE